MKIELIKISKQNVFPHGCCRFERKGKEKIGRTNTVKAGEFLVGVMDYILFFIITS